MRSKMRYGRSIGLLPIMCLLTACAAGAQIVHSESAEASLGCFVESLESGLLQSECQPGVVPVELIMLGPDDYDVDVVSSVRMGLEDLAVASDSRLVRIKATLLLGTLGMSNEAAGKPLPGAVTGLVDVYERTTWPDTKSEIIKLMIQQDDREAALRFLTDVARSDAGAPAGEAAPAQTAVWALQHMGSAGVSVLKQLNAENSVTNRRAKATLDRLAANDFVVVQP